MGRHLVYYENNFFHCTGPRFIVLAALTAEIVHMGKTDCNVAADTALEDASIGFFWHGRPTACRIADLIYCQTYFTSNNTWQYLPWSHPMGLYEYRGGVMFDSNTYWLSAKHVFVDHPTTASFFIHSGNG